MKSSSVFPELVPWDEVDDSFGRRMALALLSRSIRWFSGKAAAVPVHGLRAVHEGLALARPTAVSGAGGVGRVSYVRRVSLSDRQAERAAGVVRRSERPHLMPLHRSGDVHQSATVRSGQDSNSHHMQGFRLELPPDEPARVGGR